MTEITLATEIAKLFQAYGINVGIVALFVSFLFWQDRQRAKKETEDRLERQKNAEQDRLVLTNHLSVMIKEDTESREELAIGLTKLSDSINNFQTRCGKIQDDFQNEVDRLKKG